MTAFSMPETIDSPSAEPVSVNDESFTFDDLFDDNLLGDSGSTIIKTDPEVSEPVVDEPEAVETTAVVEPEPEPAAEVVAEEPAVSELPVPEVRDDDSDILRQIKELHGLRNFIQETQKKIDAQKASLKMSREDLKGALETEQELWDDLEIELDYQEVVVKRTKVKPPQPTDAEETSVSETVVEPETRTPTTVDLIKDIKAEDGKVLFPTGEILHVHDIGTTGSVLVWHEELGTGIVLEEDEYEVTEYAEAESTVGPEAVAESEYENVDDAEPEDTFADLGCSDAVAKSLVAIEIRSPADLEGKDISYLTMADGIGKAKAKKILDRYEEITNARKTGETVGSNDSANESSEIKKEDTPPGSDPAPG